MHKPCTLLSAAAAALIAASADATPFQPVIDEFWITKNLTTAGLPDEIFRDSFNDGIVPPDGPDGAATYFVRGPLGMASETVGTSDEGKLTMDPSLGVAQLSPEGNVNIRTAARRIASPNPASDQFLGFDDSR